MPSAESDLTEYADFVAADSAERSREWLAGAWQAIFSLLEFPKRFAVIKESEELGEELRDVGFHSHRIVFRVREEEAVIEVLRVWHMAREALQLEDTVP